MVERRARPATGAWWKTLLMAAAAGALGSTVQALPDALPTALSGPLAAALAGVVGLLLPSPLRARER